MTISKYPKGHLLTDYPRVDRGGKVFLMDSYPMEGGRHWEFHRWLCDLEVYQSAAETQGQAIVAHLQAFDNTSWLAHSGETCRAPWPEEFCQQHVAMIARGIGGTMTWGFDHVASLCPSGKDTGLLPQDVVNEIIKRQHASPRELKRPRTERRHIEKGCCSATIPRRCAIRGAAAVYERYAFWKTRASR